MGADEDVGDAFVGADVGWALGVGVADPVGGFGTGVGPGFDAAAGADVR